MGIEIKVPALGESLTEATIGNLLKPSGAYVTENEEIIELETEKVNQVLYAPQAGVLSWRVKAGDAVKVGDVIGSVEAGEAPPPEEKKQEEKKQEEKKAAPLPPPPEPKEEKKGARVMPKEFLTEEKAAPQPAAAAPKGSETRTKMTRIRKVIARRLVDALHNAAMLTTFNEVDMSAIIALRAKYKETFIDKHGVKLGFMSFFVKAAVEALKDYPGLNSYIDGEDIVHREYYDIGIAVSTDRGLVVPVVRGCEQLTFAEIEKAIEGYAKKARSGALAISDLQGGGFTLTNGGVFGSLLSTPILNPPQSGILGMHKIEKRPVVVDDQIVIRPMMYLALSYDHRVVDGKESVSFLVRMKEVLEDPSRLLLIDTVD